MEVYKTVFFLNICVALALIFCVHQTNGFWLWGNDNKDKVDGKWSQWSNYSSCQVPTDSKENFPYRFRTRKCNNPAPKAGGKPCKGQALRKAPCSDCDWPLGIENKVIKDSMITASTSHEEFPAKNARLNGQSAWCAKDLSGELFLQVDFGSLTLVTAVATQGFYPDPKELSLRLGSVSKYQITFSDDGITFEVYENSQKKKVFTGNGNNLKTVLNTFDPQIAAKHIRIHPTAYIKFVCMKFELYGCRFKCGGYLPTSPGDLLAVSSESQDVDCFWKAHSPNSSKINFDFINFNLPCKYGQVEVRGSHPFYGGSRSLGKFCDYTLAPPPIDSKGNKLWIRFQSKSPDPLVGFYGIYFPSCDTVLNSTQGTFTTPGYPKLYNHNSKCTWSITVPKGYVVMLEFLDFDIEEESGCKNDYLSVFDSNSSTIGQYCNSKKPQGLLCSSANTMRLNFRSDDVLALKGFQATYKAIPAGAPCIKPSSSIISPTPSISISTIATDNLTVLSTAMISPTATVPSPSMASNASIGVLLTGSGGTPGVGAGNQWNNKDDDDDDEDTGLTTIIIISVFSFIVLCMIIASTVPSMIHGIEKRKKKRDWLAAADLAALKKNSVVENEYEMQPMKHQDSNKNVDMEPNEETAFLDPKNQSIEDLKETPCFAVIEKEDTTSACKDEFENCSDGPLDEDLECELEYDTTDLNLSVSCEDLGLSFATEMAALMSNYKYASSQEDDQAKPQQIEDTTQVVTPESDVVGGGVSNDHINSNQANGKPEEPCNKENNDTDKEHKNTNHPEEFDQSNDKLQNALSGLKATLSDSDSCSIPEIEHPETFTSSTVSVANSQDIPSIPAVDICPAVWEKNGNDKNIPRKDTQIQRELKNNKDSSANDDAELETCV